MAVRHMVMCRVCKEKFDAKPEEEHKTWFEHSKKWYYHTKCYEEWISAIDEKGQIAEEDYPLYIYDYLKHTLHIDYNWHACETQRKKMIADGKMTNKGIYYALRYFYDIKKGDKEKSHGTIGIVPFVYKESCEYWIKRERKNQGIVNAIMQQAKLNFAENKKVVLKRKEKTQYQTDWSILEEGDFDE